MAPYTQMVRSGLILSLASLLAPALLAQRSASTEGQDRSLVRPVLVELFTSQGCSSCPPADRLLSELAHRQPSIIPLAFHVDYWNDIGWADPFSSSAWSQRQRRYGTALGSDRIYTPQLVVNGRRHGVGSDSREVAKLLRQAAGDTTSAAVKIQITEFTDTQVAVHLVAERQPDAEAGEFVVWVALVENGLETSVGSGENAHRTLRNDYVVRHLLPALRLHGGASQYSTDLTLQLDTAWRHDRLAVSAFIQDPLTLHIHAAATAGR